MKIYKNLEQRSDEWFSVRLGKFGSTDAQAVATKGKGLETLCYKKVAEIIIGRQEDSYTNEHLERGRELEPMARSAYEIESSNFVEQVGYIELSKFVGCSPDGLVGDKGMVEIKCPSNANYIKNLYENKIDTAYIWQVQHQLYVGNREWCDFIIFNETLNKIKITRIKRDESAIEKLKVGLEYGEKRIKDILEKIK
jgi:putative phage-type endonuclease